MLTKTDAGVLPSNVYPRLLSEAIFLREPQVEETQPFHAAYLAVRSADIKSLVRKSIIAVVALRRHSHVALSQHLLSILVFLRQRVEAVPCQGY